MQINNPEVMNVINKNKQELSNLTWRVEIRNIVFTNSINTVMNELLCHKNRQSSNRGIEPETCLQ
jgi:hypothetical protein